jgi:hypothetical protein
LDLVTSRGVFASACGVRRLAPHPKGEPNMEGTMAQ